MILEFCTWLAIVLVITLRSLAVYSQHFIDERQTTLRQKILGWFRFYKQGFSLRSDWLLFFWQPSPFWMALCPGRLAT
jgi:hypothetical protein